jgi:tryptophanase
MSDNQFAGFIKTDDAYAGSMTFYEFAEAVEQVLGYKHVMNTHQGRAAEHLISKVFTKPGDVVPTNYHFTTTKAHIELPGATCLEIYYDEALKTESTNLFKGNMDSGKLANVIKKYGKNKIAFVRMEAESEPASGSVTQKEIRAFSLTILVRKFSFSSCVPPKARGIVPTA